MIEDFAQTDLDDQVDKTAQALALKKRKRELEAATARLMKNYDFLRFMGELSLLQPIDDCRNFENAYSLAYINGRRSLMVEIKNLFDRQQWFYIGEFDLNE